MIQKPGFLSEKKPGFYVFLCFYRRVGFCPPYNQQPTINNQQPTNNQQQPTTNNQQPTTNNQQQPTTNQQPKLLCFPVLPKPVSDKKKFLK